MNERLKELAKQAGFEWEINTAWVLPDGWWKAESADLERFAELVRQDEREACAKLVDVADGRIHEKAPDARWAKVIGRLIRARGNK
tara:strand:+ start:190 stop:447 length:258 start_codon:yes stop_codon:yes gene_type:complete